LELINTQALRAALPTQPVLVVAAVRQGLLLVEMELHHILLRPVVLGRAVLHLDIFLPPFHQRLVLAAKVPVQTVALVEHQHLRREMVE